MLDATFYKREIRAKFLDELKGKAGIYLIEVRANVALTRKRLKKQRPDSDADFEVYKKIKQQWEPLTEDHLILRSTNENISRPVTESIGLLHLKDDKRTNR